jgi:hypothetical protein
MPHPNEKTPQTKPSQPEFQPSQPELSIDISGEKIHGEFTIPSQQFRQLLRPLALLLSHLTAAGLATTGINPALLKPPETIPPALPVPNTCHYNLNNSEL